MNTAAAGNKDSVEIIPSLLAADFACLKSDLARIEAAGCRRLHLDVMDGHFVPNISFGPVVIEAVRRITPLFLVSHLMIEDPGRYLEDFKKCGSNGIIIHQEIEDDFVEVLEEIRKMGMLAGVSIKPDTPIEAVQPGLRWMDLILIMTVEPGFGGQKFLPAGGKKIERAAAFLENSESEIPIAVDGGINISTAPIAAAAGATQLIAGSAIFKGDIEANIRRLRRSVERG